MDSPRHHSPQGQSPASSGETPLVANAGTLEAKAMALALFERLRLIQQAIAGRLVFTTSFGIEDQAITHAVLSQDLSIEIITLDTGRLFPETYELWANTERRYGRRIRAILPHHHDVEELLAAQGSAGFRSSIAARHACCDVRKVAPLARALAGTQGWITGLRADQSGARAQTFFVEHDSQRGLVKFNPLFDWTREQVVDFVTRHAVPINELHKRAFLSIGCAPCTRAVAPGEPERAGRWWWENEAKKECGLHDRARQLASTTASENN